MSAYTAERHKRYERIDNLCIFLLFVQCLAAVVLALFAAAWLVFPIA